MKKRFYICGILVICILVNCTPKAADETPDTTSMQKPEDQIPAVPIAVTRPAPPTYINDPSQGTINQNEPIPYADAAYLKGIVDLDSMGSEQPHAGWPSLLTNDFMLDVNSGTIRMIPPEKLFPVAKVLKIALEERSNPICGMFIQRVEDSVYIRAFYDSKIDYIQKIIDESPIEKEWYLHEDTRQLDQVLYTFENNQVQKRISSPYNTYTCILVGISDGIPVDFNSVEELEQLLKTFKAGIKTNRPGVTDADYLILNIYKQYTNIFIYQKDYFVVSNIVIKLHGEYPTPENYISGLTNSRMSAKWFKNKEEQEWTVFTHIINKKHCYNYVYYLNFIRYPNDFLVTKVNLPNFVDTFLVYSEDTFIPLMERKRPFRYTLDKLFDGNTATAIAEDTHNNLFEIRLRIPKKSKSEEQIAIIDIAIVNGYAQNTETFIKNNRLKHIEFKIFNFNPDLRFKSYTDEDFLITTILVPLVDTNTLQILPLNNERIIPESYYQLGFSAKDLYKGSTWNDTCISELNFSTKDGWFFPEVLNEN